MFYGLPEERLRSICRTNLESLEKWARLIIDKELSQIYGSNYFHATSENSIPIIKKDIRENATKMMIENPARFQREVDTLFLDEIIYLLCKNELYKLCFKKFLDIIYPDGNSEAHTFLTRLIPIRNKLSHSNPISIREAEQCICYCNDFIDGVKEYFVKIGENHMYNTPNAIKLNDSLGNEFFLNKNVDFEQKVIINRTTKKLHEFDVGDKYSIWLTLDPSFSRDSYLIKWDIIGGSGRTLGESERIDIEISKDMIMERCGICCTIKSTYDWHRYTLGYDQQFAIIFNVLPPRV